MANDKLRRVMWRLREKAKTEKLNLHVLRQVILLECGGSPKTYTNNLWSLKALGWIKLRRGKKILITDKDLTD